MRRTKDLIVSKEVRKSLTGLLLKGEPTPFFTLKKANVEESELLNRFPDMKWCSLFFNAAGYGTFEMEYLEIRDRWVMFNYVERLGTAQLIMLKGAFDIITENGDTARLVFRSIKLSGSFFLVDRKTHDIYFFCESRLSENGRAGCRDRMFDFMDKLILENTPQDKTLTLVGLNLGKKAQSVLMERIKKGNKPCWDKTTSAVLTATS